MVVSTEHECDDREDSDGLSIEYCGGKPAEDVRRAARGVFGAVCGGILVLGELSGARAW